MNDWNIKPQCCAQRLTRKTRQLTAVTLGDSCKPNLYNSFLTGATGVLSSWFCGNAQFDLIGQLHLCAIYKTHHRRSGAETV